VWSEEKKKKIRAQAQQTKEKNAANPKFEKCCENNKGQDNRSRLIKCNNKIRKTNNKKK